jgi:hypothetical protein
VAEQFVNASRHPIFIEGGRVVGEGETFDAEATDIERLIREGSVVRSDGNPHIFDGEENE